MVDSQLLKGILEGCVLSIINRKETYGYEILTVLEEKGMIGIGEGTLYPVLTRLDQNGYIQCRKAKSPLGPVRKYYSISPLGKERLKQFEREFKNVVSVTQTILMEDVWK